MRNIARHCYLFVPFALTFASLICLIIVLLDLSNKSNGFLSSLYFLRIDTSKLSIDSQGVPSAVGQAVGLANRYDIGLFNYCSGPGGNASPSFCSDRQLGFYFNPLQVWKLENTPITGLVPDEWQKALNTYHSASKWLSAAYIVAVVATIVTLLLGILSFFLSRITTFVTSMAAGVATLFTIAASATATAVFIIIKGVIEEKLGRYNVHTDIGRRALSITWLAAAFALIAGILWTCGCSCGRDEHKGLNRRQNSLRTRSNYERVPSPFKGSPAHLQQEPMPLHNQHWPQHSSAGYEPYRADNRV